MQSQMLEARVEDTFTLCERTCVPRFLGFLTESETAVATAVLKRTTARFAFWGGYEDAERTMLCCMPDWCEEPQYPIVALTFRYRECDTLSHRDFLGSLMALGITRESVGDILVETGRAVAFVGADIAEYIVSQTEKIGRVGVTVSRGFENPLPQHSKKESFSDTVASMRLDCVVAALIGSSRNKASEFIEGGMVAVNSVVCEKATYTVSDGDRITVRTKGKFFIDSGDTLSKKGRIILKYSRYV